MFSGGVESAYLLHRQRQHAADVHTVYVRSGYRWEDVELEHARRYLEAVDAPGLDVLDAPADDVKPDSWAFPGSEAEPPAPDEDGGHYLHGRNALVFTKASIYCSVEGVQDVFQGGLASNDFPDGTREFDDAMERALSLGLDHDLEIHRPLDGLVKHEVVGRAAEAGLPLEHTFSCVDPVEGLHCGDCLKCHDRSEGFEEAGVEDPTEYVNPPHTSR